MHLAPALEMGVIIVSFMQHFLINGVSPRSTHCGLSYRGGQFAKEVCVYVCQLRRDSIFFEETFIFYSHPIENVSFWTVFVTSVYGFPLTFVSDAFFANSANGQVIN